MLVLYMDNEGTTSLPYGQQRTQRRAILFREHNEKFSLVRGRKMPMHCSGLTDRRASDTLMMDVV